MGMGWVLVLASTDRGSPGRGDQFACVVSQTATQFVERERLGVALQKASEKWVRIDSLAWVAEEVGALDVAEDGAEHLGLACSSTAAEEERHLLGEAALGQILVVGAVVAVSATGIGTLRAGEVDEHGVLRREEGTGGLIPVLGLFCVRDGDGGAAVPGNEGANGDPVLGVGGDAQKGRRTGLPVLLKGRAVCGVDVAGGIVVLFCDQPGVAGAPGFDLADAAVQIRVRGGGGHTVPLPGGVLLSAVTRACYRLGCGLAIVPEDVAEDAGGDGGGLGGGEGGFVDQTGGSSRDGDFADQVCLGGGVGG